MNFLKILRAALSILLAFILSISFTLLLCGAVGKTTVLSDDYIAKAIKKSGYADKMHEDLYSHFVSYGAACNVGEDFFEMFFEKTFTPEFIAEDAEKYYKSVYAVKGATVDTTELQNAVRTDLKEYAVKQGYGAQRTLDEDLDQISLELGEMYKSYIALPGVSTIYGIVSRADNYINYALVSLAGLSLVCMLILLLIYKDKKASLMYLTSSFFGSFLMLLACPLYLRAANIVGKVNISGKALYSLLVNYVNTALEMLICSSLIALIAGILFLIIYLKKAKKEA